MAQAFNLTAQLNLQGPSNVGAVVSKLKKQLGSINTNVNVNINSSTTTAVSQLNASLTALNTTLANVSTNAASASAAINSLSQAMNAAAGANLGTALNNASTAAQNLNNNATAAAGGGAGGGGITQLRTEMEEFGRQSALAVRRFAAFSLVTSVIFSLTNAFNQAFKAFIDFDKEFVKLQQVTGESASGLKQLANTITDLATNLGVSSGQLTTVSSTLAQAGLNARDTEKALKALALSALAPSFDDMNKTVEGSIALMRQFGISAGELENSLGSINAVAAKFAVESSDIIAAIQRTGGVFAAASKGVSEGKDALNEFIAVFTSVRATTRESAETIATGLRTIFTRIQRGDTIEALKEYGVNLTDLDGKFVGAYKAVELLSRGLSGIDPRDLRFSQIIEELGGFRQIGKVIPLIQQFSTAQDALATAQAGQASLAEDAAIAQNSLANQFAKVREEFLSMVREIGGTDTFKTLAQGALQLASALIRVADSVKSILPIIGIMSAMRGIGALRQFGRGFMGGIRGQTAATGGLIQGLKNGGVPVALMPGETVLYPDVVSKVGVSRLRQINHADKNGLAGKKSGGSLRKLSKGGYAQVPGTGRTDSFYTTLPEDSFVIRTDATSALGGPHGVMKAAGFAAGGRVLRFGRGGILGRKQIQEYIKQHGLQYSHLAGSAPITAGGKAIGEGLTGIAAFLPGQSINQRARKGGGGVGLNGEQLRQIIKNIPAEVLFAGQLGYSSRGSKYSLSGKSLELLRDPKNLDKLKQSLIDGVDIKKVFNTDADFFSIGKGLARTARSIDPKLAAGFETVQELQQAIKSVGSKGRTRSTKRSTFAVGSQEYNKASAMGEINIGNIQGIGRKGKIRGPRQLSQKPRDIKRREERDYDNAVENAIWSRHNIGGIIQHFMSGSTKPLASMGKADLLKEASSLGIDVPIDSRRLLDPRAKGSETVRADLIRKLEEQRLIKKTATEKTSARAKKRKIAVVGLTGEQSSSEVTTPGLKSKKGGKGLPGVPATLQTGALPPEVAKKVQAIIRNRSEKIVAAVGKIIAEAAGTKALTSRSGIRDILAKQLPDLSGLMFESGIAAAGAPYDPKSKAIDFNRGLGKELSSLFGIDPKALTDATNDATQEQAKRKVKKGQFDRGRRDAIRARKTGLKRAHGGLIQKFADGTQEPITITRAVIDGDALNDPINKSVVRAEMKRLGISSIHDYKLYLDDYAASQRANQKQSGSPQRQQKRLTQVYGVAGSGKSTLAGLATSGTKGRLRQTSVFPVLTTADIDRADRVVSTTSVQGQKQLPVLSALDRQINLSTRDKESMNAVVENREYRDVTNASTLFNRKPGATKGAETYSGYGEAFAAANIDDPRKTRTLKVVGKGKYSTIAPPKVTVPEQMGVMVGNFGPTTKAHLEAAQIGAKKGKLKNEDVIAAVSRDVPVDPFNRDPERERTVYLPQQSETGPSREGMARAVFGSKGFKVASIQSGVAPGNLPSVFKTGEDEFVVPGSKTKKFEIGGSDKKEGSRYPGYEPIRVSRSSGPTANISATLARQAINSGNMSEIEKFLTPEGVQYLKPYMGSLQKRPALLDAIMQRFQENATLGKGGVGRYTSIMEELSKLPNRVTKSTPPETASRIKELRDERDSLSSGFNRRIRGIFKRLERLRKYSGGIIQQFASGGEVPILAKEGEYVINNKSAKAIGYNNLNRLNKYHSGGRVGKVKKLAYGGGPLPGAVGSGYTPVPDAAANAAIGGNSTLVGKMYAKIANLMTTQASSITSYNNTMDKMRNTTGTAGNRMRGLANAVENFTLASNMGYKASNNVLQAYQKAAAAINKSNISEVEKDMKTQVLIDALQQEAAQLRAGGPVPAGVGPTVAAGGATGATGAAGGATNQPTRMQRMGGAAMGLSFAVPMIGDFLSGGEPQSEGQAFNKTMTQGAASSAGAGLAIFSAIPNLTGAIAGAGVAVVGLIKSMDDAAKAQREFAINISKTKIESAGERLARIFEEINKSGTATPDQLGQLNNALMTSVEAATQLNDKMQAQSTYMQQLSEIFIAASGGDVTGSDQARATIFQEKGYAGLKQASAGGESMNMVFKDIAPKLARETAKAMAEAAQQIKSVFAESMRSGMSIEDLMNTSEWKKQGEILARSNAAIQEQILIIQNMTDLDSAEKKKRIDSIIATEAETQARKLSAQVILEEDLKKLQKSINQTSFSLTRMMNNMSSSIQRANEGLMKLDDSLNLAAASAAGQAKVSGGTGIQQLINIIKNPQAYSSPEREQAFKTASVSFGAQSGNIERVMKAGAGLENTILGTVNRELSKTGKNDTNEAIAAKIESAVKQELSNLQLPPSIADKLAKEIGLKTAKLRKKGEDTVDFSQLTEEIPDLTKTIDIFRQTSDRATEALQATKAQFDKLAESINEQISLQVEANNKIRNASNIMLKGSITLDQALGKRVNLQQKAESVLAPIRDKTGGTINPTEIGTNFRNLEQQRSQLQQGREAATLTGDKGVVDAFDSKLKETTVGLRDNIDALKSMADSSELASMALEEIDRVQKKIQAGESNLEKLVTSTPGELSNMNKAFARLSNNMMGISNMGTNADQRKQSLDVFNMIAPFLGSSAEEKGLKANVLQSMLAESGIGMNPMIQQMLDAMRNPESNPEMAAATAAYRAATDIQATANTELARINTTLANDMADKTGAAVAKAISETRFRFDEKQMDDFVSRINRVPTENGQAAQGKAKGGLIYRAVGGSIFQPKGTDTVPAMLTPGEFVVNRSATQKHLPLLKSINKGYSKGGKVNYLASGGLVDSPILKPSTTSSRPAKADISNKDFSILNPELFMDPDPSSQISTKLVGLPAIVYSAWSSGGIIGSLEDYFRKMKDSGGSGKASTLDPIAYNNEIKSNAGNEFGMENFPINMNEGRSIEFGTSSAIVPKLESKGFFGGRWLFPTVEEATDPRLKNMGYVSGHIVPPVVDTTEPMPIKFDTFKKLANETVPLLGKSKLKQGTKPDPSLIKAYGKQKLSDINESSEYGTVYVQLALLSMMKEILDSGALQNNLSAAESYVVDKPPVGGFGGGFGGIKNVLDLYQWIKMNTGNIVSTNNAPGGYMSAFAVRGDSDTSVHLTPSNNNVLMGAKGGVFGGVPAFGTNKNTYNMPEKMSDTVKTQLDKNIISGIISKIDTYKTEVEDAIQDIKTYGLSPNEFKSTSRADQESGNSIAVLRSLFDDQIPGLYVKIPSDKLSDEWKGKAKNGLAIFRSSLYDRWNSIIPSVRDNPMFRNTPMYGLTDNEDIPIEEKLASGGMGNFKRFPWIGNIELAEKLVQDYFQAQDKIAKDSYKSDFVLGEPQERNMPLDFTLDKIAPGLSDTTKAQVGFMYRKIDMPKLSRNTGYNPPQRNERLSGYMVVGPTTDTNSINPFFGSEAMRIADGGFPFETELSIIETKIKEAYQDYIDNKNSLAQFQLSKLNKIAVASDSWIPTESRDKAYALEEGATTLPLQLMPSIDAFKKNAILNAGGISEPIPGANMASVGFGNPLNLARELINKLLGPSIGVLRAYGYGLLGLPNYAPKEAVAPLLTQYGGLLGQLAKSFGSVINPGNPKLASVWGNISAISQVLPLIGKKDLSGLSNKIGLAQAANGEANIPNLVEQTRKYGEFLKEQSLLTRASPDIGATLSSALKPETEISGKNIKDIYKDATEAEVDKEGKIKTKTAVPPKTLLDLGKQVFNPYSSFASPDIRSNLIDYLLEQLKSKTTPKFTEAVLGLRDYYRIQDQYLAQSNTDPVSDDQKNTLNTGSDVYKNANKTLLMLTNGAFGQLPDISKLDQIKALKEEQRKAKEEQSKADSKPAQGLASGGIVYASNGTLVNFQPRGTDTVPAMLTPGEFVVNRRSAQKHLPLLHAINDGQTSFSSIANNLNNGGIVRYLQNGGIALPKYYGIGDVVSGGAKAVAGSVGINLDTKKIETSISSAFQAAVKAIPSITIDPTGLTAINNFITGLKQAAESLAKIDIQPQVQFTGSVDVNVKGVEGLNGSMANIVNNAINNAMQKLQSMNSGPQKLEVPQGDFTGG